MIDGIAGRSTSYEYDLAGRNVASTVTDTSEYDLVASGTTSYADGTGLVDKQTTTIYGANNTVAKHLTYLYGYGTPTSSAGPEAISGLAVNGEQYLYSYDTLGRLITRKTSIGSEDESLNLINQTNTGKREEYTYVNNSDGTTTTLVKSFRDMLGVLHTYEYDGNGNITSETIGEGSNVEYKTYYYDSQNRLTRYNDSGLNITVKYVYDARGNITKYSIHPYSAGTNAVIENTVHIYNYAYENSTWKDLATSIKGYTITYDAIGNPLKWTDNRTLTWENGRQLKSVNKNGSDTTYMYNGDGLRTEKWGDRTTQYIILDGTYLGERTSFYGGTTYLITYIYGAEGSVIGLDVNGTAYYFVKNLQGDVTSIIDVNGNILANYSYDAYGYIMSITDGNGNEVTSATHIANLNPFRYRGYMYDQETGFYYLRSRYYDPAVCRWLNSDNVISGIGGDIRGYNTYSYCFDNPVNYLDVQGQSPENIQHWWTVAMWWLTLVDGPLPIGDSIYGVGILVTIVGPLFVAPLVCVFDPGTTVISNSFSEEELDSSVAEIETLEETSEQPSRHQEYFPANPHMFRPRGLMPLYLSGSYNGRIIKWMDANKTVFFEWDEDYKYGPHYHVLNEECDGSHMGLHYLAGDAVPEPWNSLFFGG